MESRAGQRPDPARIGGCRLHQPLLDLLGRNPEVFLAEGNSRAEIWLFALAVTFAIPLTATLVELLAFAIDERAGQVVHTLLVGVLSFLVGLVLARHLPLDGVRRSMAFASLLGVQGSGRRAPPQARPGRAALPRRRAGVVPRLVRLLPRARPSCSGAAMTMRTSRTWRSTTPRRSSWLSSTPLPSRSWSRPTASWTPRAAELRPPGRGVHVVPERHVAGDVHQVGPPTDPHRLDARARRHLRVRRLPGQPVHSPRGQLRRRSLRVGRAVPGVGLRRARRRGVVRPRTLPGNRQGAAVVWGHTSLPVE